MDVDNMTEKSYVFSLLLSAKACGLWTVNRFCNKILKLLIFSGGVG